ncbi:hypothetical protein AB4212_52695, partial [Streptomyces sp. 2MCAF27]
NQTACVGSLRTISAAHHLGLVGEPNLPRPLRGLNPTARREVSAALDSTGLTHHLEPSQARRGAPA